MFDLSEALFQKHIIAELPTVQISFEPKIYFFLKTSAISNMFSSSPKGEIKFAYAAKYVYATTLLSAAGQNPIVGNSQKIPGFKFAIFSL